MRDSDISSFSAHLYLYNPHPQLLLSDSKIPLLAQSLVLRSDIPTFPSTSTGQQVIRLDASAVQICVM